MSFPDSLDVVIPTDVAVELLGYLDDAPSSIELAAWTDSLRIDVDLAHAQIPLFGEARGSERGDDWMPK